MSRGMADGGFLPIGTHRTSSDRRHRAQHVSMPATAQRFTDRANLYEAQDQTTARPWSARASPQTSAVMKRCENVMLYMISQGTKPNMVASQRKGDAQPVASNDTAQGRAQNRRIEVPLAGT